MSNQEYYKRNKEKILKQHSEWRKNNPEYMNEWRKKNPEYDKERWKQNKEKLLKQSKIWHKNNPEYDNQWRKDNPESWKRSGEKYNKTEKGKINIQKKNKKMQEKGYFKEWQKTEKGKANSQRGHVKRQAKEKNIINTLTAKEWEDILEKHNYRCAYCGIEFDCENLPTKDHVMPISKGGNNVRENIIPACKSCNSKKNNKLLSVFKEGLL